MGREAQSVGNRLHGGLCDGGEGLDDPGSRGGDGLEHRVAASVEVLVELGPREHVGEVAFVVAEDDRDRFGVEPVGLQVLRQVGEALLVRARLRPLRVGHEHHAVATRKDRSPRRVVLHLPGNRVELQGQSVAPNPAEIEPQQVEEEGPVGGRVERVQLGPAEGVGDPVDELQARRLAAQAGAVVDDLQLHLAVLVVKLNHRAPRCRLSPGSSTTNRAPRARPPSAQIRPPWCSTIWRAIVRPSPVPPVLHRFRAAGSARRSAPPSPPGYPPLRPRPPAARPRCSTARSAGARCRRRESA